MLAKLRRLDDLFTRMEKTLVVALFGAIIGMIGFNIVARNLFDRSYQIILEISPTLVLWLALLGSTLALKYQRHIRLEIFLRYVAPPLRQAARSAACLFGLVVMALLLVASVGFVQNEVAMFGPKGCATVILPVFFALAAFRFLVQFLDQLTGTLDRQPPAVDPSGDRGQDDLPCS